MAVWLVYRAVARSRATGEIVRTSGPCGTKAEAEDWLYDDKNTEDNGHRNSYEIEMHAVRRAG